MTINPVNAAPVAVNDSFATDEDTALTITAPGVLGNDTDVDSPVLTAVVVTGPGHGALALNANGSVSYTPAAEFNGRGHLSTTRTLGTLVPPSALAEETSQP